jgi:hypothetical protein
LNQQRCGPRMNPKLVFDFHFFNDLNHGLFFDVTMLDVNAEFAVTQSFM